jgi:hypothetical protein
MLFYRGAMFIQYNYHESCFIMVGRLNDSAVSKGNSLSNLSLTLVPD